MMFCNCALPYFNPGACRNCCYNKEVEYNGMFYRIDPIKQKITEKYDENGRLFERIVEDI